MAFHVGYHPFPYSLDNLINDGLFALTQIFEDTSAKDQVLTAYLGILEAEKKAKEENCAEWRPAKRTLLTLTTELLENALEI